MEACNSCESCESFNNNRSFNIHELDAASNNHVEDIRNLIDQIRVPPQVGKYSIYIIDEVHMLSQLAFNAFLKTLEEPPAHAVFILATTEKHKIIPTILSRCQIFDFKRISVREMMIYLAGVAEKELVQIDDAALNIIAQKADGSMRDALSIFDQVVSFSGKTVDYHSIIENLNVLDYEYYFQTTHAFLEGNYRQALMVFDEVLENGFDARNYLNGMGKHFRNLLMCKDEETIQLMELSGEISDKYRSYSQKCSVEFLFKSLGIIGAADVNYKQAKDTRLHVEIALMKLSAILHVPGRNQTPEVDQREAKDKLYSKPEIGGRKAEFEHKKSDEPYRKDPENTVKIADSVATSIKTGPRIKDFLNKAQNSEQIKLSEPTEPVEEKSTVEIALNQENLMKLWLSFAENIREDQPRLFNTLTTQKPILGENNLIRVDLNNPSQGKALASIHPEILAFLKNHTGVEDISLQTVVERENAEKKLYTEDDKFKHMQEQNPQLGLFRNTFNLDFE